jgi:oligopeptide transport system substrate-binding protein
VQTLWRALGIIGVVLLCWTPAFSFGRASASTALQPTSHFGHTATSILRIAMPDAAPTVDPALVADEEDVTLASLLYSGLVRLDSHYRVVPSAAASYTLAHDHRTYTFHLRRDLRFSNGDPVTAYDFKYSINRSLNPALKSPSAPTYLIDVQGATAVLAGQAKSAAGVRVIDRYTLQIAARWPVPYFLTELAYPTSFALDEKLLQNLGGAGSTQWYSNPVGSGPFTLHSWSPNNAMVLVRNKHYSGSRSSATQIKISLNPLPTDNAYRYVAHNFDIVYLPPSDRSLVGLPGVVETQALAIEGLYLNLMKKPFGNPLVRQGLTEAINRSSVVATSFSRAATPFAGDVPQGEGGFDPQLRPLPYSPAEARRMFAAAGFVKGKNFPSVTIYYEEDPSIASLAQQVASGWSKILNVDVSTQALTPNTLFAKQQAGALDVYISGWTADYPDPHDWLALQWGSGSTNNDVHYHNAFFDLLVRAGDVTWSWPKRKGIFNRAQQVLADDAAWIPLYIPHRLVYVRPDVKNLFVTGFGIIPTTGDWAQVARQPTQSSSRTAIPVQSNR